jgi:hypothetical protein
MKGLFGCLAGALVLTAVGAICVAVWRVEGSLADIREQTTTLQFERAQQRLDAAGDYVGYVGWVPRLGTEYREQIRVREAVLEYWQGNYDALISQPAEPRGATEPATVDVQLVVANAAYRDGQAHATDRAATLRALDDAVGGYAAVLRSAPWRPDAAYNYEYVVRLRDELTKSRRPPAPAPRAQAEADDTELGVQGHPAATDRQKFEIYIPLDKGESAPGGGDAGKAPAGARKG